MAMPRPVPGDRQHTVNGTDKGRPAGQDTALERESRQSMQNRQSRQTADKNWSRQAGKAAAVAAEDSGSGRFGRQVRLVRAGKEDILIDLPGTTSLSRALWLSGRVPPVPLCGGLGSCGRCRVRFLSEAPSACAEERSILGEEACAKGWRLACRCQIPDKGDLVLELPEEPGADSCQKIVRTNGHPAAGTAERAAACVLAVDLGTTSIAWRALETETGRMLAEGQCLNPQAGAGADVVSRIACALDPQGRDRLATLVIACLQDLVRQTEARAGARVQEVIVAGNTAMSALLLGRDVSGLAHAPYRLPLAGNASFDLPGLPPIFLPPLAGPFVGGDCTAGLAFCVHKKLPAPWLLADLGTNGEMALVTQEGRLLLTSVPLGPALEGTGLECGALAGPSVLTSFSLGAQGLVATTASGARPDLASCQGISATGCLELIALLRRLGLMDCEGHLWDTDRPLPAMPLARRLAARIEKRADIARFVAGPGLWISARDIEEILKVKAAFRVAMESLVQEAGLDFAEIRCLALAGALGEHMRPDLLENLGFIPRGTAARVQAVGNASLEGACLLGRDLACRKELARMCATALVLQPAADEDFHRRYVDAMRLGN